MVKITELWLRQDLSKRDSYNKRELRILGLPDEPLVKRWKQRLVGQEITEKQRDEFLSLRDDHLRRKPK